jgi:hypothetical protein
MILRNEVAVVAGISRINRKGAKFAEKTKKWPKTNANQKKGDREIKRVYRLISFWAGDALCA